TDWCSLRIKTHRQARGCTCADREGGRGERMVRKCSKGDRLARLRHLEAIAHGCGCQVTGIARLRRLDRALTNGDQCHRRAGNSADRYRRRCEAYRKTRGRTRTDREWGGSERLVRERSEGNGLA